MNFALRLDKTDDGNHPSHFHRLGSWLGDRLVGWGRALQVRALPARLTLQPGEVYRLTTGYRQMRLVFGDAWLTQRGHDIVLRKGQETQLAYDRHGVLVSALYGEALVLELC